MEDLWPKDLEEIKQSAPTAPVTILREQASMLYEKTKGMLAADVVLHKDPFDNTQFNYAFEILAQALDNYRYELFRITHGVDQYPVKFELQGEMREEILVSGLVPHPPFLTVADDKEFVEILEKILKSKKTRQVIAGLISQMGT